MKISCHSLLFAFILMSAALVSTLQVKSQYVPKVQHTSNELHIGDVMPDVLLSKLANSKQKEIRLSDYKNQLLLLDFMHTRCGGCLHALPKFDSLQREFSEQFKLIVVTHEEENEVNRFLNRLSKYKELDIPWVVEDSILREYFPFTIVSHLVWIYKGKVVAITLKDHVNAQNIQALLDGKEINLPLKRDVLDFDFNEPFFNISTNQGGNPTGLFSYSAFRGHIPGIDANGQRIVSDTLNKTIRYHIANRPILNMYLNAWKAIDRSLPMMTDSRIIMEVDDPAKYKYKPEYGDRKLWDEKNEITYEAVLPIEVGKIGVNNKLIHDLDHMFGLHGRWEKRKVPCYVMVKAGNDEEIKLKKEQAEKLSYTDINGRRHNDMGINKDSEIYRQETMMKYFAPVSDIFDKPLIDESHYEGAFIFPTYWYKKGEQMEKKDDLESFKKGLQECGLKLIEKDYETDVFVLTEIGAK